MPAKRAQKLVDKWKEWRTASPVVRRASSPVTNALKRCGMVRIPTVCDVQRSAIGAPRFAVDTNMTTAKNVQRPVETAPKNAA